MSAIFLDRDGVVIRKAPEGDYVKDWSEVHFLPGSLEAIATLTKVGRKVIIITNQRGLATGQIRLECLEAIHVRLHETIQDAGGKLAGIYYCPHDKAEACQCRKPRPGMLMRAAREHRLDLSECWMIGDAASDITAGKIAGCKTALISQSLEYQLWNHRPDLCVSNLATAAKHIVEAQG